MEFADDAAQVAGEIRAGFDPGPALPPERGELAVGRHQDDVPVRPSLDGSP